MHPLEKHAFSISKLLGQKDNCHRYIKGSLPKNPAPTIGVEFATKNVVLRNGGTVKAQIWDTGNQYRLYMI